MTAPRDTTTRLAHDVQSAFGLLTRLPAPRTDRHRADAAWVWPLVGAVVGGLSATVGWAALTLGLPTGLAAAMMLATHAMVTGALHEDGLADTADGLFGGWTRERRLEIMKDSHIGSYGTLALLLVTLAKWSALGVLLDAGAYGAIIAAAAISRAAMAMVMAWLPNARASGLSQSVGRPSVRAVLVAAALALMIAAPLGPGALVMAGAVMAAGYLVARLALARIGGQTGDILGAGQQLAELAALAAATALLH
ncbi:MAG: adenosylcobinamide-GDP ribazoletransferase [Rhodobacteraceae bacterium]|nr:adenosylcobinamide-GDP ribazoletransferase [Paracoccaceae bacterium]